MITIHNQDKVTFPQTILPDVPPHIDTLNYQQLIQKHLKTTFVDPLFTNEDTTIHVDNVAITDKILVNALNDIWANDYVDRDLEQDIEEIYQKSLGLDDNKLIQIEHFYTAYLLKKQNLPLPSNGEHVIRYTAQTDLIPASKELYMNFEDNHAREEFTASMGGYLFSERNADHRVIAFSNPDAFHQFTNELHTIHEQNHLDDITKKKFQSLASFSLEDKLSDGLILNPSNEQHPNSFSRILTRKLIKFQRDQPHMLYHVPVNVKESIYEPTSIIFLNLERLKNAKPKDIAKEFKIIKRSKAQALKMNLLSNKEINQLKEFQTLKQYKKTTNNDHEKSLNEKYKRKNNFSKRPLSKKQMVNLITKALKQHKTNHITSNTYKAQHKTYNRPNRRNPLDPTKAGITNRTYHHPNIHIYLDTSGSVTEDMYQESIMVLIALAKNLRSNIYFNSFSHKLSETTLIKTTNLSTKKLYEKINNIPKVGGGTEYENIWKHINKLNQSNHLNFIITDFEYRLNRRVQFKSTDPHIKQTYYIPLITKGVTEDVTQLMWNGTKENAKQFQEAMYHAGHKYIRNFMLL